MDADAFMAEVAALAERDARLSPLDAAVLLALGDGFAADSRSFAKTFGVAHALALRAVSDLIDLGFVEATSRDARTQRTKLALTAAGRTLFSQPEPLAA